jgi:hypothetical protein
LKQRSREKEDEAMKAGVCWWMEKRDWRLLACIVKLEGYEHRQLDKYLYTG